MQTALAGDLRHQSAQPMRLPAFVVPTEINYSFPESDLSYIPTPNGVLITYDGLLVAWIFKGHAGSRNNKGRCQFYDVAFPSLTTDPQQRITGVTLDSTCFDSLESAVQFVESTFANSEVTV